MILLNPDWKFKNIQENISAIKTQYDGLLLPFLWNKTKEKTQLIHKLKVEVFAFDNILYWQRERLWEVLNNDLEIEKFRRLK